MCFGHNHRPGGPNGSPAGDPSTPDRSASGNTIYGHINDFSRTREEFGWSTAIARGWTAARATGELRVSQRGRQGQRP